MDNNFDSDTDTDSDPEVCGRVPRSTPRVNWEVSDTTNTTIGNVPVVTKQLVGHVDNSSYPRITVDIQLKLTTPVGATGSVPVIMEFGFAGPPRPGAKLPVAVSGGPPVAGGPTWQEQVLVKGWGYAILIPTNIQADNGQGLTQGIIGLLNSGQPRKLDDWSTLRAWAWGVSRALDYFETVPPRVAALNKSLGNFETAAIGIGLDELRQALVP